MLLPLCHGARQQPHGSGRPAPSPVGPDLRAQVWSGPGANAQASPSLGQQVEARLTQCPLHLLEPLVASCSPNPSRYQGCRIAHPNLHFFPLYWNRTQDLVPAWQALWHLLLSCAVLLSCQVIFTETPMHERTHTVRVYFLRVFWAVLPPASFPPSLSVQSWVRVWGGSTYLLACGF